MGFRAGELLEPVLQAEFRHVLEGAGIAEPLTESASGHHFTVGERGVSPDIISEVTGNSLRGTVLGGRGVSAC